MLRALRTNAAVQQMVLRTAVAHQHPALTAVSVSHTPAIATTVSATTTFGRPTSVRWLSDASKTTTTASEETPQEAATATEETPSDDPATTTTDAPLLTTEEQLTQELQQVKDQLLRSLAEQDNTRRIATRDIEHARSFAIQSFAKRLLDVSDNLERALAAVPAEHAQQTASTDATSTTTTTDDSTANDVLQTLYEGIQLTEKGLHKAFTANGLVKYGAPGDVFDPNKHEALMEYSDPTATPGTIGQLMKPGYMLHARVLRPAEVGVIKKA